MRYCKNCHILYSSEAAACPKCGIPHEAESMKEALSSAPSDKKTVRRDWLWIAIGVPVLIGVIYLLILLLKSIG